MSQIKMLLFLLLSCLGCSQPTTKSPPTDPTTKAKKTEPPKVCSEAFKSTALSKTEGFKVVSVGDDKSSGYVECFLFTTDKETKIKLEYIDYGSARFMNQVDPTKKYQDALLQSSVTLQPNKKYVAYLALPRETSDIERCIETEKKLAPTEIYCEEVAIGIIEQDGTRVGDSLFVLSPKSDGRGTTFANQIGHGLEVVLDRNEKYTLISAWGVFASSSSVGPYRLNQAGDLIVEMPTETKEARAWPDAIHMLRLLIEP
jgi:hypothetical protein